jgi:hypothetical protein
VRFLQWNIERGYKLPGIIEELRRIDADVIALQARLLCVCAAIACLPSLTRSQEVDIGCERSGWVDCGDAIARALGAWACAASRSVVARALTSVVARGRFVLRLRGGV